MGLETDDGGRKEENETVRERKKRVGIVAVMQGSGAGQFPKPQHFF